MRARVAVLLVAALVGACRSSRARPTRAAAVATPLPSSTVEARDALPAASLAAPTEAPRVGPFVDTPAHEAYAKELDARCPYDAGDQSTLSRYDAQVRDAWCAAGEIFAEAGHLPLAARAALFGGGVAPAAVMGINAAPWGEMRAAACRVEGVQTWSHEGQAMTGSEERVRWPACIAGANRRLAFVARSWREGKAADVAAFVAVHAAWGPDPAPQLARWKRYAKLARRTAPHSVAGCSEMICRMTDAEWIALERDADRVEAGSAAWAAAACDAWPELASALGGAAPCRTRMAAFWLPRASYMTGEWAEAPAADEAPPPPDPDLPPPADDEDDAAGYERRRSCPWAEELACAKREHAAARLELAGRTALLAWDDRVSRWRDRLCRADLAARYFAVDSSPGPWLAKPDRAPCGTGDLLIARLLRLLAQGDRAALVRHLEPRLAWGDAVLRGLRRARDDFAGSCRADKPIGDCAPHTTARRPAVVASLDAIARDAAILGGQLCSVDADLRDWLGADCAGTATSYLLSIAEELGRRDRFDR